MKTTEEVTNAPNEPALATSKTINVYLKGTPLGDLMEAKGMKLANPPIEVLLARQRRTSLNETIERELVKNRSGIESLRKSRDNAQILQIT